MAAVPSQPARCRHCLGVLPASLPGREALAECPFCGHPISPNHEVDVRDRAEATRKLVDAQKAAQREREYWREEQRKERAKIEERFQRELIELEILDREETSAVVVVPTYDGEMTPLPEERKQRFVARLAKLAEAVFNEADDERGSYVLYERDSKDPAPTLGDRVLVAGCSLCRGWCCTGGGEHAFLDRDSLKHRIEQHGFESPEALVAAYQERLPSASIDGSCVFHTDHGCNVPRAMRGFTCNSFLCGGLDQFENHPPPKLINEIAIVAQRNGMREREQVLHLATDVADGESGYDE